MLGMPNALATLSEKKKKTIRNETNRLKIRLAPN